MASLSVRRLDPEVYDRLKRRAAEHGVSLEEEIRRILMRAVQVPDRLGDLALSYFGPARGVDLELPPRERRDPPDLAG